MIDKEKIAYAKGMSQAYFNIAMKICNERPNINLNEFIDYCLDTSKEIDDGIKNKFNKE